MCNCLIKYHWLEVDLSFKVHTKLLFIYFLMSSSASRFYYQLVLNNLEVSLDTMYMNTFTCSFPVPQPTNTLPPPK